MIAKDMWMIRVSLDKDYTEYEIRHFFRELSF